MNTTQEEEYLRILNGNNDISIDDETFLEYIKEHNISSSNLVEQG